MASFYYVNIMPSPIELFKVQDKIIEKEDYDFIIFLCIFYNGKKYLNLIGV
jgi:hypothetical protein